MRGGDAGGLCSGGTARGGGGGGEGACSLGHQSGQIQLSPSTSTCGDVQFRGVGAWVHRLAARGAPRC